MNRQSDYSFHLFLSGSLLLFLILSGWQPVDRFTWILEVLPVFIGGGILFALYPQWTFSRMVCWFLWGHAMVLMVGGHYTYAQVPLFNGLRDAFHLSRNHYDRLGHFFQGMVPALVAREVFIRRGIVRRGPWLVFIVLCVCMAISAWYELLEWQAAIWSGTKADAFLGTQGDPWDTQEDMAMAFVGAIFALSVLRTWHDRSMQKYIAVETGKPYKEGTA